MSRERVSSLIQGRDWFEAFAKQELEGKWRPIPNLKSTIVFFAVLTIITIPLGGGIYHSTLQNSNFSERYPSMRGPVECEDCLRYDDGGNSTVVDSRFLEALFSGLQTFTVAVNVTKKMDSPVSTWNDHHSSLISASYCRFLSSTIKRCIKPLRVCILHREVRDLIVAVLKDSVFFTMDTTVIGVTARGVDSSYTQQQETKDRRSLTSIFKDWWDMVLRQELPSFWHPLPSVLWSISFFAVLSVITVPMGSLIIWQTLENTELIVRYDSPTNGSAAVNNTQRLQAIWNNPVNGSVLRSNMTVPRKMHSPVYLYYELKDYYQNHKRYVRSAEFNQIAKGNISRSQLSVCKPYNILEEDESLPPERRRTPDERVINPCGLVAHSYFNDSFSLITSEDREGNELGLQLKENGIATEWDRKYLYGDHNATNFNQNETTRGGNTIDGPLDGDEHFMVWMKVGSRPTIRKLYAIIEDDIPKGAQLTFEIKNRYNTYDYGGEKRLILSTANWTGGRNVFTGALFFAIGGASALACFAILLLDRYTERSSGDIGELSWVKKKKS